MTVVWLIDHPLQRKTARWAGQPGVWPSSRSGGFPKPTRSVSDRVWSCYFVYCRGVLDRLWSARLHWI